MFEKYLKKAKESIGAAAEAVANGEAKAAAEKAFHNVREKASMAAGDAAEKLEQSYVHSGRWEPLPGKLPAEGILVLAYAHLVKKVDSKENMKFRPVYLLCRYIKGAWHICTSSLESPETDLFPGYQAVVHSWTTLPPRFKVDINTIEAMLRFDVSSLEDAKPENAAAVYGWAADVHEHGKVDSPDPFNDTDFTDGTQGDGDEDDWDTLGDPDGLEDGSSEGEGLDINMDMPGKVSKWDILLRDVRSAEDAQELVRKMRDATPDTGGGQTARFLEDAAVMACILYVADICEPEDRSMKTAAYLAGLGLRDCDSPSKRPERSDLEKLFCGRGRIADGQFEKVYEKDEQDSLMAQANDASAAGAWYRAYRCVAPEMSYGAMLSAQMRLGQFA